MAAARPAWRPRRAGWWYFSSVSSRAVCPFGADHPPKVVTRCLRANEPRTAPTNEVAVRVMQGPAGPIATWAGDRVGGAVTLIHDIARGWPVVARLAVGDRAADDGAADDAGRDARTDRTAIATGIGRGRGAQGTDRQSAGRRKREHRLLHLVFPPGSGRRGRPRMVKLN